MEHENCIGESDEWYTPPEIFEGLGCRFGLDPFSPSHNHWTPADRFITKAEDGLTSDWGRDFVWVNPPFGGRNGHVPALEKFIRHGNGIALVRAYTSAGWFHDLAIRADAMIFPRGKTKFIRPDGTVGKSPGAGIVLLGVGVRAWAIMASCPMVRNRQGWFVNNKET